MILLTVNLMIKVITINKKKKKKKKKKKIEQQK